MSTPCIHMVGFVYHLNATFVQNYGNCKKIFTDTIVLHQDNKMFTQANCLEKDFTSQHCVASSIILTVRRQQHISANLGKRTEIVPKSFQRAIWADMCVMVCKEVCCQ